MDGKIQPSLFFHVRGIKHKYEHIEYTLYNEAVKYIAADTEAKHADVVAAKRMTYEFMVLDTQIFSLETLFTSILYSVCVLKFKLLVPPLMGRGGPSFLSKTAAIIVLSFLCGYRKYGLF